VTKAKNHVFFISFTNVNIVLRFHVSWLYIYDV